MKTWVRQRLKTDRSPDQAPFPRHSARSSKVDFAEPDLEEEAERSRFYYSPPIGIYNFNFRIVAHYVDEFAHCLSNTLLRSLEFWVGAALEGAPTLLS